MLIERAEVLTTFSKSSALIVAQSWPEHRDRIVIRPHKLPVPIGAVTSPSDAVPPVIGVLGNINHAKGAEVIQELSRSLAKTKRGRIVLIGNLQPGYSLARPSLVTGSYRLEDLDRLIKQHQISRWFFPSVWPETFSFVVHEMLATDLPVWSFDIGAQADAVRAAAQSGKRSGLIDLVDGKYDEQMLIAALTGPITATRSAAS